MRVNAWIALLVLIVAVRTAAAQDGSEHTHTTLPSFKLEGGKGKTALEVDLEAVHGLGPLVDLGISASFKATAVDGITTILSTDGASLTPGGAWQLGVAGRLIKLRSVKDLPHELVPRETLIANLYKCRDQCDQGKIKGGFCDTLGQRRVALASRAPAAAVGAPSAAVGAPSAAAGAPPAMSPAEVAARDADVIAYLAEALDPSEYCPVETPLQGDVRDGALELPEWTVSGGLSVGQVRLKWLEPAAADPALLTSSGPELYPQVTLAGAALLVSPALAFTQEYSLRFDSSWKTSETTAKWCRPGGMVTRPDEDGADPAQICDELPIGHPQVTRTLHAAAYFGRVGRRSRAWRAAIGPVLNYTLASKGADAYEVSVDAPIYLKLSTLKQSLNLIARFTPSLALAHGSDGENEARFLITLAILGERSMFPGALD